MNNLTLSGHLTHEPKLIHRSDRPICEMRLAVDNGKHTPTYIDVRTFDDQAYACAEYLHKGSKIGVNGQLIYEEWRAADDSQARALQRHRLGRVPRPSASSAGRAGSRARARADPQLVLVG